MKLVFKPERMLQLAKFMHMLPREQFDLAQVRVDNFDPKKGSCGSIGCAIGWCEKVFPELVATKIFAYANGGRSIHYTLHDPAIVPMIGCNWESYDSVAKRIFGIPISHAADLFTHDCKSPADGSILPVEATPRQMAHRIRTYVKWRLASKP